jgi:hypothetical protein
MPRSWPEDTPQLVREVDEVRWRGATAFRRRGLNDRLATLTAIGQSRFPDISIDSGLYEMLRAVLSAAIPRLETKGEQDAARELLGLTGETMGHSLTVRQSRAASALSIGRGMSRHTFRGEPERFLVERIANKVLSLIGDVPEDVPLPDDEGAYISRQGLHHELEALVASGQRLIVLRGDAGTGKSRLALEMAKVLAPSEGRVVVLRANDPDLLLHDILGFLSRDGMYADVGQAMPVAYAFKRLLEDHRTPAVVVVIDNVEDDKVIDQLVPASLRSVVLVTSRESLLSGRRKAATVLVENMEPDEAVEMVRSRIPGVEDNDARLLASALDGRPLAIEHACALIMEDEAQTTIEEFCRMLRIDVAKLLDAAPANTTLVAIYRSILKRLGDNQLALGLMDLLTIDKFCTTSSDVLELIWYTPDEGDPGSELREKLHRLTLRQAMRVLQRMSLVRAQRKGTRVFYSIHPLTLSIIRELREGPNSSWAHRILETAGRFLGLIEWDGGPLPHIWRHWDGLIVGALLKCEVSDFELVRRLGYPRVIAAMLRSSWQWDMQWTDGETNKSFTPIWTQYGIVAYRAWENETDPVIQRGIAVLASEFLNLSMHTSALSDEFVEELRNRYPDHFLYDPSLGDDWHPTQLKYNYSTLLTRSARGVSNASRNRLLAARWHMLRGTVFHDHARWRQSEDEFEIGFSLCADCKNVEAAATTVEIARRALELHIKTCSYDEAIKWMDRQRALKEENPWQIEDDFISTRLKHTMLNWERSETFRDRENWTNGASEVAGHLFVGYRQLLATYPSRAADYWVSAALYGWACSAALVNVCTATEIIEKIHKHPDDDRKMGFECLLYNLAACKIAPAHAARHDVDPAEGAWMRAHVAASIASKLLRRFHSPYWCADALVTALALGKLGGRTIRGGQDWLNGIQASAIRMSRMIGRSDKVELAERVGESQLSTVWLLAP